jgi:hypothetical protein
MRSGVAIGAGAGLTGGIVGAGVLSILGIKGHEASAFWATIYALAWWIVGWFAVMPPPLRYKPWAAVRDPALFQLAGAGLLACLVYGAALAVGFTLFGRSEARNNEELARSARAVSPSNGALGPGRR